jgi:hypothetical protein
MSKEFESRLRAALRPVAPSDRFTRSLVARMAAEHPSRSQRRGVWPRPKASAWWLSASLAASILIAIGAQRYQQERRDRETGMEARREVVEALRMTSQKLNLAYETVKSQSTSLSDDRPGV